MTGKRKEQETRKLRLNKNSKRLSYNEKYLNLEKNVKGGIKIGSI